MLDEVVDLPFGRKKLMRLQDRKKNRGVKHLVTGHTDVQ